MIVLLGYVKFAAGSQSTHPHTLVEPLLQIGLLTMSHPYPVLWLVVAVAIGLRAAAFLPPTQTVTVFCRFGHHRGKVGTCMKGQP